MNLNDAIIIKNIIESSLIQNLCSYASKAYPNESCGFILKNGGIHPAFNAINSLYDKTLTTKNAFLIDSESWKLALSRESPITTIYHSHTDGTANMSYTDILSLKWEHLSYLIIGIKDFNPTCAKLFWWESNNLCELNIQI